VDHPAAGVQRQHTPALLANQLLLADRWGQPCRAYNVCIRPGPAAAAALAALQVRALRLEPSLLRVPGPARRTKEGLSKKEIIRCLKRYVAREVYHQLRGSA
jgi:hypothetical protein